MPQGQIAFRASPAPAAQDALVALTARYGQTDLDSAQIIVALGGDGFMLQTLHDDHSAGLPVYGMNCGTVGFLMNTFSLDTLPERLALADEAVLNPAGSTAYNYSAHGPILPIGADVLALTAVAAFRPRRWRGALLPKGAVVRFEVLDPQKRPVRADADTRPVTDVASVEIRSDPTVRHRILFDPGHGLEERLIVEQFA